MKRLLSFINNYLLVYVTLVYILGIALSPHLRVPLPFSFIVSSTLLPVLFTFFKKNNGANLSLLVVAILFGCFNGSRSAQAPSSPDHIYSIAGQYKDQVIIGRLHEMARTFPDHTRLTISSTSYRTKDSSRFNPATGRISVRLNSKWNKNILPGDRIVMRVKLSLPKPASTPGSFDYKNFLARQDIWVTGFLKSPVLIEKLHSPQTFLQKLRYQPERTRTHLNHFISTQSPKSTSGLYNAILTGDKTGIPPPLIEGFKATGLMHILAVSGLHISILALFLYTVFYWICSRSERLMLATNIRKLSGILTIVPLSVYALLAGGNPPVVRSLIMAATITIAICSDRKKSISTIVAFAALLILLFHPQALFTASFQLSFMAVIFILAGSQLLVKSATSQLTILQKIVQWIKYGLLISLLATIGTTPLLLFYFNRISWIGPVTNLLIEPLICFWSLPFGFLALSVQYFSPDLAALILQLGALGLTAATQLITLIQSFPLDTTVWMPPPSTTVICLYYISCCLMFLLLRSSAPKHWKICSTALFFLLNLFFLFGPNFPHTISSGNSRISCIDVGQGSSSLIITPEGKTVLIDGGGGYSPTFNVGERIIAPYLWKSGIRKLDHIIITHPDSDHYNGIYFLLKHFSPSQLWISELAGDSSGYTALLNLAKRQEVILHKQHPFAALTFQNSMLHWYNNTSSLCTSDNDSGLVARYEHGEFSMLFPGDIEIGREKILVEKHPDLNSTLLLAPHHGSKSSSSQLFLHAVQPEGIVISSGKSKYFPAEVVLQRYEKLEIPAYLTRQTGTLMIVTDGKSYTIQPTLR